MRFPAATASLLAVAILSPGIVFGQGPLVAPAAPPGAQPKGSSDLSHPMSQPAPESAWIIPCRTDPSDAGWCAVWFSREVPMGTECSCNGRKGRTETP